MRRNAESGCRVRRRWDVESAVRQSNSFLVLLAQVFTDCVEFVIAIFNTFPVQIFKSAAALLVHASEMRTYGPSDAMERCRVWRAIERSG
jgi:hypothetical protein